MSNRDARVIEGFGDEWTRFDQSGLSPPEREELFAAYFAVFPWSELPEGASGFDLGCGSGRWARLVAPRVGTLHCIDASEAALEVARRNCADRPNCRFHQASVDQLPLDDGSMDFGYSLGVLHHVPDTAAALAACVRKLKPGAPVLLYLYYAFDNRPPWFRLLWKTSEAGRFLISRTPHRLRYLLSQAVALTVYWPLSRLSRLLESCGRNVEHFPLAFYRNRSLYVMRTDALDRFGTRLEQRFTRSQIHAMMETAGLERITFSEAPPFWCAVGHRR